MHKNTYLIIFLIFLFVSISTIGLSSGESNNEENKIFDLKYRAVRAMGMGDAFGALADDGDAFFYNPSGI
ncbi:MAG: hypothetical protein ACUVWN_10875, partial [bacterium]